MACFREGELLRYLDGSMPNATHEAVQRHLEVCVQCGVELQRLAVAGEQIHACLAALAGPEDSISVDVQEALSRLRNRIHERPTPGRKWALVWATAVVATFAAVIAIGIHGPLSHTTGKDERTARGPASQASTGQPQSVSARPVRPLRDRIQPNRSQSMDEYMPLDGGAPMQMGVVVRVTLPATAFARFGVSGSGNLQADVLVGDDGIAHAVRLVPQE